MANSRADFFVSYSATVPWTPPAVRCSTSIRLGSVATQFRSTVRSGQ